MGKGQAKRHRDKRAANANISNLHKAQKGKALAFAPLPDAPKDTELTDRASGSLRKLMALQEMTVKEEAKKTARQEKHKAALASHQLKSQGVPKPAPVDSAAPSQQSAPAQPPAHGGQQGEGHHPSAAASDQGQAEGPQALPAQRTAHPKHVAASKASAAPQVTAQVYKSNPFEQDKPRGLADRKKQFLNRKKEQKKKKGTQAAKDEDATPADLKLQAQNAVTRVRFGETSAAPLKVQLKRKHWAGREQQQGGPTPGNRLGKLLSTQLNEAQQRMDGEQPTKRQRFSEQQGKKHKGKPVVGQVQEAREKAAKTAKSVEQALLREHVVAAYRNAKQQGRVGQATMQSLKGLVARGGASASAASALS